MDADKTDRNPNNNHRKADLYFKEYCEYTGIHGLRYIAEDRTLCERITWIIAVIVSMILSGLMIYEIMEKYLNYPVIVTFSMQEVHMNEIPFPAVTICPRSKISQKYFNVTEAQIRKLAKESLDEEMKRNYNLAATICDFSPIDSSDSDVTSDDFYSFLNLTETEIYLYASYTGIELSLYEGLTHILTEEGNCYSFNIMDKRDILRDGVYNNTYYHDVPTKADWTIEEGYTSPRNVATYPIRALRSGAKNGFFLVLKTKREDIEHDCSSDEHGYRAAVHLPSKIPDMTESYFTVPLNQRVSGQIIPHLIRTSSGVKAFDPSKRDCYFQSERSLKFFKIYSQENCLIECRAEFQLQRCGCVSFHMPRYNDTPVCILDDMECLEKIEDDFTALTIDLRLFSEIKYKPGIDCDCLPSCTDLTYSLEISQSDFVFKPHDKDIQLDEDYVYTILNLYFKRNHLETKERSEVYGFSDFISNFGGLVGLFTGFSMLSFIEIIYFLSLRIWGNIKLYGNWSGKNK